MASSSPPSRTLMLSVSSSWLSIHFPSSSSPYRGLGVVHHGCVPSVRFRYLKLKFWIVLWWRQFPLPCKLCALQRWPSNLVLWQRTSRCVTVGIHRSTRWNRHAVFWSNRHVHSSRFCVSRRPRTLSSSLAPRIEQACCSTKILIRTESECPRLHSERHEGPQEVGMSCLRCF